MTWPAPTSITASGCDANVAGVDAREQLSMAFEMFNAMGIRGSPLVPSVSSWRPASMSANGASRPAGELTAQEAQVARLARDGLSNVEIGGRLFISQHTVAYHLRKVFSKLGVTSRNQLGRERPESATTGQAA